MKEFREPSLADRLGAAARARQAQLEKARAKAPANDPQFAEKQAARLAASEARDVRAAERKVQKRADEERQAQAKAAEEIARGKAQKEADEARQVEAAQASEREAAAIVARKAERDARYAARKARKK